MTLVDTSVWLDHFRRDNPELRNLLEGSQVLMHAFVLGEIACGNLSDRSRTLADLQKLPRAILAGNSEVVHLIEARRLWGRGIGWIDAHLLASALITGCRLWTLDSRLRDAASTLHVEHAPI